MKTLNAFLGNLAGHLFGPVRLSIRLLFLIALVYAVCGRPLGALLVATAGYLIAKGFR